MLRQLSAQVDKFGTAYAILHASQKEKMVQIEYYLILDDCGNATIKGGILEVEALLENTMESYLNEHINEALPYMVIRNLVDNHEPQELEALAQISFKDDPDTIAAIKAKYPSLAALIVEKCTAAEVKTSLT